MSLLFHVLYNDRNKMKQILELLFFLVTVKYVNDYSGPKTNTFSQLQNYTKFNFTYKHIIFSVRSVCLVDTVFFFVVVVFFFFFIKCLDVRVNYKLR